MFHLLKHINWKCDLIKKFRNYFLFFDLFYEYSRVDQGEKQLGMKVIN